MSIRVPLLVLPLVIAGFVACSDDDKTTPPGPSDDGGTSEPDSGGRTDAGSDTGSTTGNLHGCNEFVDRTAESAERSIQWDFDVLDRPERCMKVKVGQTVTWGDGLGGPARFESHPITAAGGDKPSPIESVDTETGKATFDKPGTFGFECGIHGAMVGVIQVVP